MVQCGITDKWALPEETAVCQLSEQPVVLSELVRCTVTGTIGARTMMCQSHLSNRWCVPEEAVTSQVSRRKYIRNEVVTCQWRRDWIPKEEAGECTLTHAIVSRDLLNSNGELAVLRDALDGSSGDPLTPQELIETARPLPHDHQHPQRGSFATSPRGVRATVLEYAVLIVFGKWQVGFLSHNGKLVGKVVRGRREGGHWKLDRTFDTFANISRK